MARASSIATHRATPASTPRRAPAIQRAVVARCDARSRSTTTTTTTTRRDATRAALSAVALARVAIATPARAFERPPIGFARYTDAIDGYGFDRPSAWVEVRGSGNDVFFRDASEVETNAFVAVSSPSSSAYESVEDLGTAEDAAKRVLEQYVGELMSTRLGVRREKEILNARRRTKSDGKVYYDVEVRISSYSARNQYGLTAEDRPQTLEWDRTLRSALGTENGKLYELRLQSPTASYEKNSKIFDVMVDSFRQFEADTPSVSSYIGLRIGQ